MAVGAIVAGGCPSPVSAAPAAATPGAATPGDGVRPTYRPPVDAPVLDPFRPPPEPWLAGNRGLEYATVPGTPVTAIGPGVVVFAGPVAGSLHVTVRHPDGLRSSYSFLAAIRVRVGDAVAGGDEVGVAGASFHVGVRRGDRYLDPASLWGRPVGGGAARLVPDPGAGDGPRSRGRARPEPGLPGPVGRAPATGLSWAGMRLGRVVGASLHSFVGPPRGGP